MPNPVPYQSLFDIDGLNLALKELEATSEEASDVLTSGLKKSNTAAASLIKQLQAINEVLNKPIKLTDDAGQQQVLEYAKNVATLTNQIKDQQKTIDGLTATLNTNKQAIADAKLAAAEFAKEQQNLKAQQESTKLSIQQQNLFLVEQKGALTEAQIATQKANQEYINSKTAVSASNLANQQYIVTLKQEQIAAAELRTKIAALTLESKQQSLANKQASLDAKGILSPYQQLSQQLTATRNSSKDFAAQLILNGKTLDEVLGDERVKVAVKNVGELDKTVKGIDSTFGQSQRNVGNYGSVFQKAFSGIRTLANIIPNFGIGTFFLLVGTAIASAAEATGLFTRNLSEATIAQNGFNEAFKSADYTKAVQSIAELTVNIDLAKKGLIDQGHVVDEYNKSIGTLTGNVDTLADAEAGLTKGSGDFIRATLLKAAAQNVLAEAAKKVGELAAKNSDIENDEKENAFTFSRLAAGAFNASKTGSEAAADAAAKAQAKIKDNNAKIEAENKKAIDVLTKFQKETADIYAKYGNTNGTGVSPEIELQSNIALKLIDIDKNAQQKILDNAKTSYKDRLAASTKFEQDTIQAAKVSQDLQLTQTGLSGNQIALIHLTTQNQITEAQNAGIKQRQDLRDKASAQDLEHLKNSLQAQKDAAKLVLDNPDATVDQKQSALDTSNTASKGIIGATYNAQVKQAGAVTEALKLAKDDRNKALLQLDIDYQNESNKILEDGYNKQIKAAREHDKQVIALINQEVSDEKDALSKRVDAINQSRADEVNALSIQYGKGLLTEQQYNNQVKLIDDKFNAEKLQEELKTAEQIVAIRALVANNSPEQQKAYDAAKKNVADITLALTNLNIKTNTDKAVANVEKLKQAVDALNKSAQTVGSATGNAGLGSLFGDLSTDLVNGIGKADEFQKTAQLGMDAVSAYTDFAINSSKARIKALQDEADHDVGLAGDNAEAKARIQDAYNKKIAEEQNKQARLQKAAAVVDIAINTAVAISKTLATTAIFGIPLIPIIAALGALEIGLVLAQPTPQYATGRNGGPAEFAEVNERGPELIGQKGKYRFANRGMRGFVKLNAGDEVKTAMDTKMMLANGMITADGEYVTNVSQSRTIYDKYIMASNQQTGIDYGRMQDAVAGGVSGLPVSEHHWNEKGYQQNTRIKNTRIMDVNRRNRF